MTFLHRALTHREIIKATKLAQRALARKFLRAHSTSRTNEEPAQLLASGVMQGEAQAVVKIGTMLIGERNIGLVAKFRLAGPASKSDNIVVSSNFRKHASDEEVAARLRRERLPVAFHHVIGEIYPGIFATISEDLSTRCKLEEAHGFNFDNLDDNGQLKKEFELAVSKMEELKRRGELLAVRHAPEGDAGNAFRKALFVQFNPRLKVGKLVVGDIEHLQLNDASPTKDLLEFRHRLFTRKMQLHLRKPPSNARFFKAE